MVEKQRKDEIQEWYAALYRTDLVSLFRIFRKPTKLKWVMGDGNFGLP